MAFASDRRRVATGQLDKLPKILVWDAISMQVKQELQGKLRDGIRCLAFSPSGKRLAAVDSSEDHQVAVFDIETGVCLAIARGDKAQIVEVAFRDESSFATVGV